MIYGRVRDGFPRLLLSLPGQDGSVPIEFLVDTAFDGAISLPKALVNRIDVSFVGDRRIQMADGTRSKTPYFQTEIVWDDESRLVDVALLDNAPLLGVELLKGYGVRLEMIDGGEVSLEAID